MSRSEFGVLLGNGDVPLLSLTFLPFVYFATETKIEPESESEKQTFIFSSKSCPVHTKQNIFLFSLQHTNYGEEKTENRSLYFVLDIIIIVITMYVMPEFTLLFSPFSHITQRNIRCIKVMHL